MLAHVVEYLRSNDVPFRLESYPSPEPEPQVSFPVGSRARMQVETRVLRIDGRPAIGCIPRGDELNLAGLRNSLGAKIVEEGGRDDLSWLLKGEGDPLPPLGRLFGVPVFIDERVAQAPVVCFGAFAPTDFVEVLYDDLARIEQPWVGPVGIAGELPSAEPLH